MNRLRHILFASAALLLAPGAALAEKIPLTTLNQYINGITTAVSAFTQVNSDGSLATGSVFLDRPGKVRFEYDPPNGALVVASAGTVIIRDRKSNTPAETYPLRRTPLSLILNENVDLRTAHMVVGYEDDGEATTIVAQDPQHPDYGSIEMRFTKSPIELRQWVITDDMGDKTTVILNSLRPVRELPSGMFNIEEARVSQ